MNNPALRQEACAIMKAGLQGRFNLRKTSKLANRVTSGRLPKFQTRFIWGLKKENCELWTAVSFPFCFQEKQERKKERWIFLFFFLFALDVLALGTNNDLQFFYVLFVKSHAKQEIEWQKTSIPNKYKKATTKGRKSHRKGGGYKSNQSRTSYKNDECSFLPSKFLCGKKYFGQFSVSFLVEILE